jgi:hypothetical protein
MANREGFQGQCAKCGTSIPELDLVEATLQSPEMRESGETQAIFLHRPSLFEFVDSSVPLHPDLLPSG